MAASLPTTREAVTPATGDGLCVLSTAKKDNDHGFLQEKL